MKKSKTEHWSDVLKEGRPKRSKKRVNGLPPELRGPAQNKYGGHRSQRMKPIRGSKLGPANEGRTLTAEEKIAVENELRKKGLI